MKAKLILGLVSFAIGALQTMPAGADESWRNERGRVKRIEDEFFEIAAPAGYRLCGPPDGAFFRSFGFHIPLDKTFSCLNYGADIGAEIAFYVDNFTEVENDSWLNVEGKCVKSDNVISADFSEVGNAVSGRPTRTCTKMYKDDRYEKLVVVRRGDYDKQFDMKYYNFYAKSSLKQRKEIDDLLAMALGRFKVLSD